MKLELPEKINREEWLKFLQVKGEPKERLARQMEEAETLLLAKATPRSIYRVLKKEDVPMEGFSIEKHLEGCDRVAILAMTIGGEIDRLIMQYEVTSMAMAVLLDTGASVLAEQMADEAERIMTEEIRSKSEELYFTPRFSPGYGDYPVKYQAQVLTYVDAARKIGITLTSGDMMVPTKSVTALVGLADHPVTGRLATCAECVLRDKCTLWREGDHC